MNNLDRWEKGVVISDIHIPFQDNKAVELATYFIRWFQPDHIVINGDLLDFWEISKYDKDPEINFQFKRELELGRKYLKHLRKIAPDSNIVYVEGNHEWRMKGYIISNAKELRGLEGLSVQEQLHLDDLDIEYVELPAGLSRWDSVDYQIGDLYIGHYNVTRKHAGYTAKGLVADKGVSVIQAHNHKIGSSFKKLRDGRILRGFESGCLCDTDPNYMSNPNWQQGFVAFYKKKDSNQFRVNPIRIIDHEIIYGNFSCNYNDLYKKDKNIIKETK